MPIVLFLIVLLAHSLIINRAVRAIWRREEELMDDFLDNLRK